MRPYQVPTQTFRQLYLLPSIATGLRHSFEIIRYAVYNGQSREGFDSDGEFNVSNLFCCLTLTVLATWDIRSTIRG